MLIILSVLETVEQLSNPTEIFRSIIFLPNGSHIIFSTKRNLLNKVFEIVVNKNKILYTCQ